MRRHELYRFYDVQGELLYVGITGNIQNRMGQHRATQAWWDLVGTMTVQRFDSRKESEIAERTAIRDESPIFNTARHSPSSLIGVGLRPSITACWVCKEPVVDQFDDTSTPMRDHIACNESVVSAYEHGRRLAVPGVV